jgi:hypothetical protein
MNKLFQCILFILLNFGNTQSFSEIYNITNLKYFKCQSSKIDCSNAGICTNDKEDCTCFDKFKTVFEQPEDYFSNRPRCNYNQKLQLYAIILALFISFGTMHFYLGNYVIGVIQTLLFVSILILNIALILRLSMKHIKTVAQVEYRHTMSTVVIMCLLALICFFWYLFDIFMLLFNVYKDSNNVELFSFFPS